MPNSFGKLARVDCDVCGRAVAGPVRFGVLAQAALEPCPQEAYFSALVAGAGSAAAGRNTVNRVPWLGCVCTCRTPLASLIKRRTMFNPRPVPWRAPFV